MTKYTREEIRAIRKYRRDLKARRVRFLRRLVRLAIKISVVFAVLLLLCKLFSLIGIDPTDEISSLEKYPTPQSYVDYLNSLPGTTGHITVEDLYGDMYR